VPPGPGGQLKWRGALSRTREIQVRAEAPHYDSSIQSFSFLILFLVLSIREHEERFRERERGTIERHATSPKATGRL
jgi:hypothetical protein